MDPIGYIHMAILPGLRSPKPPERGCGGHSVSDLVAKKYSHLPGHP